MQNLLPILGYVCPIDDTFRVLKIIDTGLIRLHINRVQAVTIDVLVVDYLLTYLTHCDICVDTYFHCEVYYVLNLV